MNIISESLILIGATIMLFAIFKTRNILKLVKNGKFEKKWKILVSLMVAFFLGYLATAYLLFSGIEKAIFIISGAVFFLGALFVYLVVRTSYLTIGDLGNALEGSKNEVGRRIKLENEMEVAKDNLKQQNAVLLNLAKAINEKSEDYPILINQITEAGSEILNIERVSVWYYDELKTSISCFDLFEKSKKTHSKGTILNAKDYPLYFEALEKNRIIDADDANSDPRTKEFSKLYLTPLGITSMLDVAIWIAGKTKGILCFEHVGPARTWTDEEKIFARTLADLISLAIETSEKIKTEEKLRKSEERFRRLSEASFEGVIVHNKGKIVETNSAFAKLYGYNEAEIIGRDVLELIAPESKELCKNNLEKGVETPYEAIALRKNNTVIYIEIIQKPFTFNGELLTIMAVHDVTWKKKAEQEKSVLIEELKKSQENLELKIQERTKDLKAVNVVLLREMEERKKTEEQIHIYEDLVKNVPIGLAIFQFENKEDTKSIKLVLANPTAETFTTLKVEDTIGKYWADISPETYETGRDKIFQEVIKTGKAKDFGTIHYKGNAQIPENYFHTIAFPLPNNSFGLSVENVTEKVKTEERFQRIYEGSPSALIMLDRKGNIFETNSQAEELYGYTKQELKKMNYVQLVPERFRKDFVETCKLFFANPEDSEKFKKQEKVILKKDGTEAIVEKSLSSIQIKSEVYLLAAVVDITARKKANEQIQIYKDVVKNVPIGLVMFQFENINDIKSLKVLLANPAAEKFYNAKAKDFVGKYLFDFSPDSFQSGRVDAYRDVVKRGQTKDLGIVHYKGSVKTESGAQLAENYFHFVAFPLPNNSMALSVENVTEQVKTEERFERVVEASPSAMLIVDKEGKITLANSQAEILYGYSRRELQNMNIKKLVPSSFEYEFVNYLENIFKSLEGSSGFRSKEGFGLRKDGLQFPVDLSFSAIYTKTGVFTLVSILDITERKKAEEKIHIYENVVNNIPIGLDIMKFDNIEDTRSLKVITTNPAYNKYTGIKGSDMAGKYAVDLTPEIFKSGQDKVFQEIIKTGLPKDLGTIHHEGNGTPENYIHISAFPIPQNYIAVSYENITEQVKIEERFRLVVEAAPIAMIMVDKSGKISVVNSQAENLFGYTKDEFRNLDFGLLFAEQYRKEYLENRQQFFESPTVRAKIQKLKQVILKKDKSEMPVEISFVPIYSGNAIFMLASIPDNVEQKKAEEKIVEEKKTEGEKVEDKKVLPEKIEDKILDT